MTVPGGVGLPRSEAGIAFARRAGALRVDALEIGDDGGNGAPQAVDVESPELDLPVRAAGIVVDAQVVHELFHLDVAPHPGRKAFKRPLQRLFGRQLPDEMIDRRGIRPIGLDRDDVETVMLDQLPGDAGTRAIELGRAVRRFSEHYNFRFAEPVEERGEVVPFGGGQMLASLAQEID